MNVLVLFFLYWKPQRTFGIVVREMKNFEIKIQKRNSLKQQKDQLKRSQNLIKVLSIHHSKNISKRLVTTCFIVEKKN